MASAKVDPVRSICAVQERGDYEWRTWEHPEIVFVIADGPVTGTWTGVAGSGEGSGGFLSAWEEFHVEVDECRELDRERVLAVLHLGGARRAGWSSRRWARRERPCSTSATAR